MSNFWTNPTITPKRNFRFLIQFQGFEDSDILWFAKTVKLPAISFGETEHDFLDNKFYFPGRATWEEVNLTLVDPASPDATQKIWQMLENSGYVVKANAEVNSAPTISKVKATNSGVKGLTISVLDEEGKALEEWSLNNPFIKSVSFSDLDYTNEDLRQIDMTIRYDWATCKISSNGRDGVVDTVHFKQTTS